MYCEICNPKLTSLDNMMLDMSMESARILLDSLEEKKNPSKIMLDVYKRQVLWYARVLLL